MPSAPGVITAQLSAEAPQIDVLTPLAIALGARVGLSVEQIDDLAMALELLVGRRPATAQRVTFAPFSGGLDVSLSDVDDGWLERQRPMLGVLVSEVVRAPDGVRLRAVT